MVTTPGSGPLMRSFLRFHIHIANATLVANALTSSTAFLGYPMKLHKDSHLDHGINDAQLSNLLQRFEGRTGFFIATYNLPDDLGDVPCALFGPLVGDMPVPESEVVYRNRGEREYPSRIIETAHMRRTRKVTVIAGPHGDESCVLYTAFGGPQTPQEPGDLVAQIATAQKAGKNTAELWEKLKTSREFWSEHALIEVVQP